MHTCKSSRYGGQGTRPAHVCDTRARERPQQQTPFAGLKYKHLNLAREARNLQEESVLELRGTMDFVKTILFFGWNGIGRRGLEGQSIKPGPTTVAHHSSQDLLVVVLGASTFAALTACVWIFWHAVTENNTDHVKAFICLVRFRLPPISEAFQNRLCQVMCNIV